MLRLVTRLINSEFDVSDEGQDHESIEAASRAAILTAFDVAKGLYADGELDPRIEIRISEKRKVVARHFVTIAVRDLEER